MDLSTATFGIVVGSWLYPGILCCGCILLFGDGHSLVVRHVGRIECHQFTPPHLPNLVLSFFRYLLNAHGLLHYTEFSIKCPVVCV